MLRYRYAVLGAHGCVSARYMLHEILNKAPETVAEGGLLSKPTEAFCSKLRFNAYFLQNASVDSCALSFSFCDRAGKGIISHSHPHTKARSV
jgi:hypothetical protein